MSDKKELTVSEDKVVVTAEEEITKMHHRREKYKYFDEGIIFRLAASGLRPVDICTIVGCSTATLYNNDKFKNALLEGRAFRTNKILDINFELAVLGDSKAIDRELKMSGYLNEQPTIAIQQNIVEGQQEVVESSTEDLLKQLEDE